MSCHPEDWTWARSSLRPSRPRGLYPNCIERWRVLASLLDATISLQAGAFGVGIAHLILAQSIAYECRLSEPVEGLIV
jgi:hypothetical protein